MGHDAIAIEYHRAVQTGATRAIERFLCHPDVPRIASWEITASGAVRGQLLLPDQTRDTVISAVRDLYKQHPGSKVVSRARGNAQLLGVRLEFKLWDFELWAYTRAPDGQI
ncbi:hypothetical protein [Streptomyces sp. NEAU-S7GS2]|uniref:hypothetical protein n=1 Tax=Streptomyces sp. NEAU-S7GS2 TaxID=2202000 RepID=UPI000D6EBFDA|nr:hypothetical protein [Streptomyces sp. NEAU-S7GS2]AWN32608.1 hypothetical protein DKG71_42265 [Streptomyces sp. NEAU-S7GS2]